MKKSILYYSVGALLYCPANNERILHSLISEKFGRQFSLALCLEDTISDNFVAEAENQLISTIQKLSEEKQNKKFLYTKDIHKSP